MSLLILRFVFLFNLFQEHYNISIIIMILNCLVLILIGYILYKMYMGEPLPFINNYETFVPLRGVSAWDGRGTDLKKCLNNIEGVRHYYYRDASNVCDQRDPFNKYL